MSLHACRRFVVFAAGFALPLLPCVRASEAAEPPPPRARVVRATDAEAVNLFTPAPDRVRALVDAALLHFTSTRDIGAAWKKLVLPTDRIGIKINSQPGPVISTHACVVDAVVEGLVLAGIPRDQIIIFDRYAHTLEAAGYGMGRRRDGLTVLATTPDVGYDPDPVFDFPVLGMLIWGDLEFNKDSRKAVLGDDPHGDDKQTSTASHFSRILTRQVDKVINIGVPVNDLSFGMIGCEWNVTFSLIDNFRRLQRPGFAREDSITSLFASPIIRKKCVLHILDALLVQCGGGQNFDPNFCWAAKSIYVSNDAIAVDTLALRLINQRRAAMRLEPIKDQAAYIESAGQAGLGVSDLSRIDEEEAVAR